jgi:hypothetical protein
MFGVVVFIVMLSAIFFGAWGGIRAYRANKPELGNNRTYMVYTFWILLFATILWLVVGLIRCFGLELPSWGYFVFAGGFAWESYAFRWVIKEKDKKK